MLDNLKSLMKSLLNGDTSAIQSIKEAMEKHKPQKISTHKGKVVRVENVGSANGEYVYDIGMRNESKPWFFASDILVHNSCYFSAYETFKDEIESGQIPWTTETVIQLYDHIGEEVNKTFPSFMERAFNCPQSRGQVIKAGREIVAPKALFITKKRYAAMVCDVEGKRTDLNGSPGYLKAMGLDLKRSDTPEYIQDFLKEILTMVLTDASEADVMKAITDYRAEFRKLPAWEKGSPKRANNIAAYQEKEEMNGKSNMPGHVRASINWNTLRRMNNDRYSAQIVDGTKVVVCKLKPNDMGFTSIARPVDEERLPKWFTDLPFDEEAMEMTLLDGRLDNLIGVLNYDLSETRADNTFNNLFDW